MAAKKKKEDRKPEVSRNLDGTPTILAEAFALTNGDRQAVYGHPSVDFKKVGHMARPLQEAVLMGQIPPELYHPLYLILVKIARLCNTPLHRDSVVDIAGYANTYQMVADRLIAQIEEEQKAQAEAAAAEAKAKKAEERKAKRAAARKANGKEQPQP